MAVVGFKYVIVGSAVNKARFSVWRTPPKKSTDPPPQEKVSAVEDHMTSSFWRRTWEFIKKDSQLQEETYELQLDVEIYRALAKQKDRDLRQYKRWYDKTQRRHQQVLKESELFYETSQELKQHIRQLRALLQQYGIPWRPLQKDGEQQQQQQPVQQQQQQQQLINTSSVISSSSIDVAAWRHRSRSSDADSAAEAAELVKLQKQRQAEKVECLAAKQEAARLRAALAEAQNTIQHLQHSLLKAQANQTSQQCTEPSFTAGGQVSSSSSSALRRTPCPTKTVQWQHDTCCMVTANSSSSSIVAGGSSGNKQASWSSFTKLPDMPSFSFQGTGTAAATVSKCSSMTPQIAPTGAARHAQWQEVDCDCVI